MASVYRLSPPFAVRLVGSALVLVAVLVFAVTLVAALAGWSVGVLVGIGLMGLVAVGAVAAWLSQVAVVRFDAHGYRVRLVRGVGVAAAPWTEVTDAVPAAHGSEPCVVLRLADERTTTIPLSALNADPSAFVADLREHLQRGHGLRPL
ncbi:MAG: hypothetical protein U0R80_13755 [Nocardioidaceae bacterium]